MSLFGKVFKGTGYVAGGLGYMMAEATGGLVGGMGKAFGVNEAFCDNAKNMRKKASVTLFSIGKTIGNTAEKVVDYTLAKSGDIGSFVAGEISGIAGASEIRKQKSKTVGRVVGGAAVGFAVGSAVGGVIKSVAADGLRIGDGHVILLVINVVGAASGISLATKLK